MVSWKCLDGHSLILKMYNSGNSAEKQLDNILFGRVKYSAVLNRPGVENVQCNCNSSDVILGVIHYPRLNTFLCIPKGKLVFVFVSVFDYFFFGIQFDVFDPTPVSVLVEIRS